MMEMTPAARQQLDDYLQRLSAGLRGARAEVAEEVEQSVREHIEIALEGAQTPVSATEMIVVLDRLGAPEHWLGEEERPAPRRAVDDSPLPYVTFGLVLISIATFMFFGFFLLIPAMFVSRAWIEQRRERAEPLGSRRWLVYPAIVLVLAFAAVLLLAAPPLIALPHTAGAALRAVTFGVWWIIAAALCAAFVRPIRFLFEPLLDQLRRKHFALLAAIGALLAAAGSALLYYRH